MAKMSRASRAATAGSEPHHGLDLGLLHGLSVRAIMTTSLERADAAVAATEIAVSAALAVAECQWTLLQETWRLASATGTALLEVGGSSGAAEERVEWFRRAGERFIADGREFAGLLSKANTEMSEVWRARLAEMIEDAERLVRHRDG